MRSLQDVGREILSGCPTKFYVFCGSEYGIKERYLETIREVYGGHQIAVGRVADVVSMFKTRQLIPPPPALYVVRYDEEFLASLSDSTQSQIQKLPIRGTLVCIYEDARAVNKLDKYLPDFSVVISAIDTKYIAKYLKSEFPKLNDRFISIVSQNCANYGHARRVCACMSMLSPEALAVLYKKTDAEILQFFGSDTRVLTDADLSRAIASRDFSKCLELLPQRSGDLDSVIYTMLSTLLDLEKLKCKKYASSVVKDLESKWTLEDICNMFLHTCQKLEELRSISSDTYEALIYLFALLRYERIPEVTALCSSIVREMR